MRPYRESDEEVQRLHAACATPLLGLELPTVTAFVAALNHAVELSTMLYEGESLSGALMLLADPANLSGFSVRVNAAPIESLRSLVAAAAGGQVLVQSHDGVLRIVGVDLQGYEQPFGIRFGFKTPQRVFVQASGVLIGASVVGQGITVVERTSTPEDALRPALLGALSFPRLHTMLDAMRTHRHGGLLIIDPSAARSWGTALMGEIEPWRFGARAAALIDDATLRDQFLKSPPVQTRFTSTSLQERDLIAQQEDRLTSILWNLGRLARADGAVVINSALELVAIGRNLSGSMPQRIQLDTLFPAPSGPKPGLHPPTVLGGTRAQAAVCFINEHPRAVAMVVSSDGPVKLIHNHNGSVRAVLGIEAFL